MKETSPLNLYKQLPQTNCKKCGEETCMAYAAGLIASIFLTPLAGLIASPVGLYMAELGRLHDRGAALASTKAYMTGWGWSLAARIGIGILMLGLWMLWAFL